MIIQSNYLTNSGLTKSYKMLLRASSKYLLNTDKLAALTSCLGSLFQGLNTHSSKKCFLTSSPSLLWSIFKPLLCVLSLDPRRSDQNFSLHLPSSGTCREQWNDPFFSPNLIKTKSSAIPQKICLPHISPALSSSSGHIKGLYILLECSGAELGF